MKFDVCIPTKNSRKVLGECLDAIKKSIPNNRIFVVDGYSSDDTVKIAEKYGCEVHYCKGELGEARNRLIELVTTDRFLFIDSDVVVNRKWFGILINAMDKNVGAINGFALPMNSPLAILRKHTLLLKVNSKLPQRGFTSNTIIRKGAVKGVRLPNVKRCEDIILQKEVEKRGWKWSFAPAFCVHLKNSCQILKEASGDLVTIAKTRGLLKAISGL